MQDLDMMDAMSMSMSMSIDMDMALYGETAQNAGRMMDALSMDSTLYGEPSQITGDTSAAFNSTTAFTASSTGSVNTYRSLYASEYGGAHAPTHNSEALVREQLLVRDMASLVAAEVSGLLGSKLNDISDQLNTVTAELSLLQDLVSEELHKDADCKALEDLQKDKRLHLKVELGRLIRPLSNGLTPEMARQMKHPESGTYVDKLALSALTFRFLTCRQREVHSGFRHPSPPVRELHDV
jgi:hypothetical protein